MARIGAHLRRSEISSQEQPRDRFEFPGLAIDLGRRQVFRDGEEQLLTLTEFNLLALLASRPGQVMSRGELLRRVWGYEVEIETRTVDAHVYRLRRKIEPDPEKPTYIHSVPGHRIPLLRVALETSLRGGVVETGCGFTGVAVGCRLDTRSAACRAAPSGLGYVLMAATECPAGSPARTVSRTASRWPASRAGRAVPGAQPLSGACRRPDSLRTAVGRTPPLSAAARGRAAAPTETSTTTSQPARASRKAKSDKGPVTATPAPRSSFIIVRRRKAGARYTP